MRNCPSQLRFLDSKRSIEITEKLENLGLNRHHRLEPLHPLKCLEASQSQNNLRKKWMNQDLQEAQILELKT